MSTDTPLPPEPEDGTALYWPETAKKAGGILIRDDRTAGMLEDPEHHWFSPGSDEWTDWPYMVTALTADGFDLSAAIVLSPVAEVERLRAALRLCEHVLHRASPTDAMLHAAQQASGAHVTDWTVADVLDDLAPGSVLGAGVVDWAGVTWADEDSPAGAR